MYQRKKSVFLTEDIQLSSESRSTGTPAEDDGGALALQEDMVLMGVLSLIVH